MSETILISIIEEPPINITVTEEVSSIEVTEKPYIPSGIATLVNGTATVPISIVDSTKVILLTNVLVSGIQGVLSVGTIVPNTSFVINSTSDNDNSKIAWAIL
jgi:hypothetical protein